MDGKSLGGATIDHREPLKLLPTFACDANEALLDRIGDHGFKISAARSWDERSSASKLINRMYSSRGYRNNGLAETEDPNQLTLVASSPETLVGTLTISFDGDEGLLADDLFPDQVNALRASGKQVCEFTKLAMDSLVWSQRMLAAMFHVAFIHAHRIRGCDNLLVEVNPCHTRYYESMLGFEVVGPQRLNRRVNAPAVLLSLDLWHAQERIRKCGESPEVAAMEKSFYRYAFSDQEQQGILSRLRKQQVSGLAALSGELMA